MTTVAVCRRTNRMFADTRVVDSCLTFKSSKIVPTKEGLLGSAGSAKSCEILGDWLKSRGKEWGEFPTFSDEEAVEGLELTEAGILFYQSSVFPMRVEQDYYAIGSGAPMVMAVLRYQEMHGLEYNMLDAMKVACEVDTGSGLPIDVVELKIKKKRTPK